MASAAKLGALAGLLGLAAGAELRGAGDLELAAGGGLPEGVQMVDFYRAMNSGGVGKFTEENNDLASLGGVLKYVMTEILVESSNGQNRQERKYSVDVIMKERYKIKNKPENKPDCTDVMSAMPTFTTYDQGQSTNPDQDVLFKKCGDWVGVQPADDIGVKMPAQDPPFWYSVGGFCPNLPWQDTPFTDKEGIQVTTARCTVDSPCKGKGKRDAPNSGCITTEDGDLVMGGLCREGGKDVDNEVPEKNPEGVNGCVYTYGKAKTVKLDDIAGITKQICSNGQPCKDWKDFRHNCADASLRKMFDAKGDIIDAKTSDHQSVCVEYDIHPNCKSGLGCADPKCAEGQEYELGLPFWRGRCSAERNRQRLEIFAAEFGIDGARTAHNVVAQDILGNMTTCNPGTDLSCKVLTSADGSKGGPYCSRFFSGICARCYIHGAVGLNMAAAKTHPRCNFDVLSLPDYAAEPKPVCESAKASQECCLYTESCEGQDLGADKVPLDADGLALVVYAAWKTKSSEPVAAFMKRVAAEHFLEFDEASDEAKTFAYDAWGAAFTWASFDAFTDGMKSFAKVATTTTAAPVATTTTADAGGSSSGGGMPAWAWILIVVGILIAAGALGYVFMGQGRGGGDAARGVEMRG